MKLKLVETLRKSILGFANSLEILCLPFRSHKSEGALQSLPMFRKRKKKRNPDCEFLGVKKSAKRCLHFVYGSLLGSM